MSNTSKVCYQCFWHKENICLHAFDTRKIFVYKPLTQGKHWSQPNINLSRNLFNCAVKATLKSTCKSHICTVDVWSEMNFIEKKQYSFAVFNLRIARCDEFRFNKALEGHKRRFMAQHDKQQKSRRLFQLVSSPLLYMYNKTFLKEFSSKNPTWSVNRKRESYV